MAKIAVVGLGYVGLPLLLGFSHTKNDITGFDVSKERVDQIKKGNFNAQDSRYEAKPLKATTKAEEALPDADYIIICVPTPIDENKNPDVSHIKSASETIAKHLRKGQTIKEDGLISGVPEADTRKDRA